MVFFSNAIFRQAGITSDTLASATVGAVNVIGTFVASLARAMSSACPCLLSVPAAEASPLWNMRALI